MFDLLLRGGTCVTPSGRVQADVAVRDRRIAALGALDASQAKEVFDATGLHVLPGVVDPQCHFREPGLTHKEDLNSGSAQAALGGVTTFFEMPNTTPNTDNPERLAWKVERARETSWVDFGFFIGATNENAEHLAQWETLEGCAGVKMFCGSSTGTLLVDKPENQRRVMKSGRRRICCHSEDEARLKERKDLFAGKPVHFHPEWRDEDCAVISTRNLLQIAKETGRRLHILHVTTAGEIPLLSANKHLASFEVCPQHLTLAAPECYDRLGTLAQMNPPIRDARHQAALWEAIRNGAVDVLGSDHAPHTLEEKSKPWPASPSGMPGVQTLVPLMLNHVAAGRLTLERFVDLTSAGPARVFGMRAKGRLAPGYDADLTVVDLNAQKTITNEWSKSRCGWTPFDGLKVTGWPIATIVRGSFVMRDGALQGTPRGLPVRFD
ncbi:MAG: dihydroorotase [Archangium gephyra]|uniref:Dihydroorotase n=1 Tax=Archangium gephyra TaxID=48 RepID=A0A2W5TA72_9BACT|nr:MAG: dihydroorotase [Archangium gephyra]